MQLVKIGESREKTLNDLIQELAARQGAEIELLKRSALERESHHRNNRSRCTARVAKTRLSSS